MTVPSIFQTKYFPFICKAEVSFSTLPSKTNYEPNWEKKHVFKKWFPLKNGIIWENDICYRQCTRFIFLSNFSTKIVGFH
jgi:hypothetical protein